VKEGADMSKRILIVDDEEDMLVYLQTLFRKAGYETETATNGDEAIEKIGQIQPDLITLDILMPKKSGLNFFQALRTDEETKHLPVIVLSGITGHRDFFEDESEVGPTIFIEKPIEPDSFLASVKQMLKD
jgi:CheY-like chemotaxis protein